ncbi:MAG: acyl-CoA dehydrogenase family protein [Actinomycetota bacterium]|nr:acyl-CoA dehydrogenase family protein [Actinomycetota bacterium]
MADQPAEERFRAEALAFLSAHARPRPEPGRRWGQGSDRVWLFVEGTPEQERALVEEARRWRQRLFDAGFGWITGPLRYGGRGLPLSYERIYRCAEAGFETPSALPFGVGLGVVAPAILAHGTDPVKDAYLGPMHRGDVIGCQLFSEPGAGSDLASVETRAVRHGDQWSITGRKMWTSGAHFSDIGEILCRTDPAAPKHRGITAFVVDMSAPGVRVRPLRQMTGGASINEVVLEEVPVPDDHRLGEVNDGWRVAVSTVVSERRVIGGGAAAASVHRLVELLRWLGKDDDPVLRQRLADVHVHDAVAGYTKLRAMAEREAGREPGAETSIAKLALTDNLGRVSEFLTEALGPRLTADTGEWGTFAWAELVLGAPGLRIAGGTDEVQKNVIAERVLGLPREARPESPPFSGP